MYEETTVKILLRPVGSAPVLDKQKFKLSAEKKIFDVQTFLQRKLSQSLGSEINSLFLYVSSCGFSPLKESTVGELFDIYGTGDELTLTYGVQETWG